MSKQTDSLMTDSPLHLPVGPNWAKLTGEIFNH